MSIEVFGMTASFIMPFLFFLVAMLYSSVGHGGASGYLALFALMGAVTPSIVPMVLILNIVVATISFLNYWRRGHFSFQLLLPFVVGSIPAAFVGAMLSLPLSLFRFFLSLVLIAAALRMLFFYKVPYQGESKVIEKKWLTGISIGIILGFISGIVGIGGGIFLSPILLLTHWANPKRTAALSSAFIILNSMSGLLGQISKGAIDIHSYTVIALCVLGGGMFGSYVGSKYLSFRFLNIILSGVLFIAGMKLLFQFLHL